MGKRIAIFGISGSTGQALVASALQRNFEVIGLARPLSQLSDENPNVEIVRGDLSDQDSVVQVIKDADAVFCVLGPRPPFTDVFCAGATAAILQAMQETGLSRLICVTGAMIGPAENRAFLLDWMAKRFMQRAPEMTADRHRQEELIMTSDTDWTLVKPPRLT
ncbi:MAG: NAD(P)H-binding protein, partial [Chloroflexota bacterium]